MRPVRGTSTLGAALLLALAWASSLIVAQGSSTAQRPTFRADTDLVQVDVSVLDGKRRPVRGLTVADFTVLEDGKARPIATFAPVELPGVRHREADTAAWTREIPRDLVTNDIPREGRLVVILFDRTIRFEDSAPARRIALSAVDALDEGDMAALVFTSQFSNGGKAVDFTADRAKLREAIAQPFAVMPHDVPNVGFNFNGVMIDDPDGLLSGDCYCGACVSEAIARLADTARDLPARTKTLLFIGTYYPGVQGAYRPQPDLRTVLSNAQGRRGASVGPAAEVPKLENPCWRRAKDARDAMVRATGLANLRVHVLDPTGLETSGNSPLGGGTDAVTSVARSITRQSSLSSLADLTGGRVVMNTNAPEALVSGVLEESGSYYLLGFERANRTADGKLHRIEVKVKGCDLNVRARSGYLAPSTEQIAAAATKEKTPIDRAIVGALPETALRLGISVASFARDDDHSLTTVAIRAERPAVAGDATAAPGTRRAEVLVGAFDRHGNSVASAQQTVDLAGPEAMMTTIRYETVSHLTLKPGHYDLRVAATDSLTKQTGSVHATVDVPDVSGSGLRLSDLVLSQPTGATSPLEDELRAVLALVPTPARTFSQADTPSAFLRVYQGGRSPLAPVSIAVQIRDATDRNVVEARAVLDAARFETSRRADYQFDLPLAELAPGEYLVSVSATLGNDTRARRLRFRVQ